MKQNLIDAIGGLEGCYCPLGALVLSLHEEMYPDELYGRNS